MKENSEYFSDAPDLTGNYEKLIRALSRGEGLTAITEIGSEILENPIALADTTGKVLAVTDRYMTLDTEQLAATKQGKALISSISSRQIGPYSMQFLRISKRRELMYKSAGPHIVSAEEMAREGIESPCSFLDCGLRIKGVLVAMLSVADTNRPFKEQDVEYCRHLADLACIELQKNEVFQRNYGVDYEVLLTDLLEGRVTDSLQVRLRLQSMNKELKSDLYVLAVRHPDPGASYSGIPKIHQAHIRSFFPGCISVNYKGDIVLLVSLEKGKSINSLLTDKFTEMLKENEMKAGISEIFHDPIRMSRYYGQAVRAIEFSAAMFPSADICFYYDISFFHGMRICSETLSLRDMSHPVINTLNASKDPKDHELLKTLYAWLFCARDTKKVTDILHIHPSTLYYRLDKIKDLLGKDDLNDGEVIFKLMLSFKLVEFYSGLVDEKASYWFKDIKAAFGSSKA